MAGWDGASLSSAGLRDLVAPADDVYWLFSPDWDECLYRADDGDSGFGLPNGTDGNDRSALLSTVHPDDRETVRDRMDRLAAGEAVTFSFRVDDRGDRQVSIRGRPIFDADGDVALLAGYAADDGDAGAEETQRYRTFRRAVEKAGVGIVITDADGVIEYVNPAFEEQSGYDRSEVVGRTPNVLNSDVHDEGFFANLWETITEGDVWDGEVVNETKAGEQYVVRQIISPLLDEHGDPEAFISANRDVTDRLAYEERLERQAEQLELLNRIVCHDIRNDMQVVRGMADLLDERVAPENREYVDRLADSADHAVELTSVVRDLVETLLSDAPIEPEPTPLRDHLEAEIEALDRRYGAADVSVDGPIPDVSVLADDMLPSVFENVLNNAVQHNHRDDPTVVVEATADGETARIDVADDGPGVPPERREELFGKGEKGLDSSGTGLGLYLVDTLVTQYGGDVWIEDNEPAGAVVCIELDVAEEAS